MVAGVTGSGYYYLIFIGHSEYYTRARNQLSFQIQKFELGAIVNPTYRLESGGISYFLINLCVLG